MNPNLTLLLVDFSAYVNTTQLKHLHYEKH
jgi:hypothetical protein